MNPHKPWTMREAQQLILLAATLSNAALAERMNRPLLSVKSKLHTLGFRRPKSYFEYRDPRRLTFNRPD